MSSTKLAVIVVGGGIGGLACALALRQAGHQVTVLESTAWLSETGAAVTVQPNSGSALSKLGLDMQDLRGTKAETAITHLLTDLDGASEDIEQPWVGISKQYDCPVHFVHREDLHNALKARCSDPTGQGTPVELKLSSCVTAYDINAGDVTVSDGNKYSADVVVAADGVRSIAHNEVLGYEYPAFPSNLSNVRFILPTQVLEDDPELAPLLADGPSFVFWAAPGRKRILMRYPCRDNELQTFGAYVVDDAGPGNRSKKVDRNFLIDYLSAFPPAFHGLASKTDDVLSLWQIAERDPLTSFHRGKLVLLGDAAHPMQTGQGQGAAHAIEDAAVLGEVLSDLQDKSEIDQRLELYSRLRVNRCARAQVLSRVNAMIEDVRGAVDHKYDKWFSDVRFPETQPDVSHGFYSFDCVKNAKEALANHDIS